MDYLNSGKVVEKETEEIKSKFVASSTVHSLKKGTLPESSDSKKASGYLHIMAHHIAIDGWSLDLLINDLGLLYDYCHKHRDEWISKDAAMLSGDWSKTESTLWADKIDARIDSEQILHPSGASMAQYAYYQRHLLASSEGDRMFGFWQRTLAAPLPILNLMTDRPRPPIVSYRGKIYSFTLPVEISDGLRKLAKSEKSTVYMLLLATYFVMLQKYTHQV